MWSSDVKLRIVVSLVAAALARVPAPAEAA